MNRKILIFLLSLLSLMVLPSIVQAATITASAFNKNVYLPGQTGYLTVTIHNDEDEKIRITDLTATIDYYYTDGNVYLQSFFTNATLPVEIPRGNSSTFYIPFSLPTNIAPGYTDVYVKAITELWRVEAWSWSDHPHSWPTMHIESSYKQQLEEQQVVNRNTTTMMYLFGATTIVFVAVAVILYILSRGSRAYAKGITHPIA